MPAHRPIVLITGFGPFPGQPQNASSLLAEALAEAAPRRIPGFAFEAATLPTEWVEGPAHLTRLLERFEPALAIHFGVSRRASGFVVETRARNVRSATPDACGVAPDDGCVDPSGPDELRVTLPTGLIAQTLRRHAVPVQLSRDAGGYLCNAVLYHSLAAARSASERSWPARRGFIHIPDTLARSGEGVQGPGQRRAAMASRLDWDEAITGGLEILAVGTALRGA